MSDTPRFTAMIYCDDGGYINLCPGNWMLANRGKSWAKCVTP
jgi:hypothetical protein